MSKADDTCWASQENAQATSIQHYQGTLGPGRTLLPSRSLTHDTRMQSGLPIQAGRLPGPRTLSSSSLLISDT